MSKAKQKPPKKIGEMNKVEMMRELGRWMKKVEDQHKIIAKQKEQIDTYMEATAQLNLIVDAILIEILHKFGTEVGDGIKEIIIPEPKVQKTPTEAVGTIKNKDKTYTMRLEPIQAVKNQAQKKLDSIEVASADTESPTKKA